MCQYFTPGRNYFAWRKYKIWGKYFFRLLPKGTKYEKNEMSTNENTQRSKADINFKKCPNTKLTAMPLSS